MRSLTTKPQVLGLKPILMHFLDHRKAVVVRRTRFDLHKAEARAHILEGILKALDQLDEIITTIRSSENPADARERLMDGFALSEIQAQAILDMRLQRLTGLEREKVVEEYRQVSATIERLRAVLASDSLVLAEILGELVELEEVYGDDRRTEIIESTGDISIEDMIADEDMVITVTNTGYVKRSSLSLYRAQHRGGKGRTGMVTREGDVVEQLYVATAHSYILVFTEMGRVYWLKVHQIPEFAPRRTWQGNRKSFAAVRRGEGRDHSGGEGLRGRAILVLRHPQGHGEKNCPRRLLQPSSRRHYRHSDRRRRQSSRCPSHRWREGHFPRHSKGPLDPLSRERRASVVEGDSRCGRASDWGARMRWSRWRHSRIAARSSPSAKTVSVSALGRRKIPDSGPRGQRNPQPQGERADR